jgi:hypothetical protein
MGALCWAPAAKATLKDNENNAAPNVRLIFATRGTCLAALRLIPAQWIILRFMHWPSRFLWFIACLGNPALSLAVKRLIQHADGHDITQRIRFCR